MEYIACHAIIFYRPRGTDKRNPEASLALARRVAASADSFLAAWRELLVAASEETRDIAPPPAPDPSASGGGAAVAFDNDRE
jgi:hypothetical protein